MNKILQRSITGIVYVALLILASICSPALFAAVFCILMVLGLFELYRLCNINGKSQPVIALVIDIAGALVMFLSVFAASLHPELGYKPLLAYLVYPVVRMTIQLYLKHDNALEHLAHSFLGQILVALPLSLLNLLYFLPEKMLLVTLVLIWMNDTGAFCIGSLFGRHKLFERISPKKSWEGFFGGLFFSILTAIVIATFFDMHFVVATPAEWILYAVIVTLFATWGDLIESVLKRTVGVKDSSHILPGHGGILDRIDSLLLVIPVVVIYLYFFK